MKTSYAPDSTRQAGTARMAPATTLLIVDDDLPFLETLSALVPSTMRVVVAVSCTAAIELIASHERFHALVVNARLGNGSGFEILDRWIAKFPGTPTIVMMARSRDDERHPRDDEIANEAYLRGSAFLRKPFRPEVFEVFTTEVEAVRWGIPRALVPRFPAFIARHRLTERQADLLARHIRGVPRAKTVEQLGISPTTLRTLIPQLCEKLGVRTLDAVYERMMRE